MDLKTTTGPLKGHLEVSQVERARTAYRKSGEKLEGSKIYLCLDTNYTKKQNNLSEEK